MHTSQANRRARIALIRDGAHVRARLGQAALHELLPDGQHEIVLHGQRFTGKALQQTIDAAKAGRGSPQ